MTELAENNLPGGYDHFPQNPGEWAVRWATNKGVRYRNMWFVCPGCSELHAVPLEPERPGGWTWDAKAQSLTPSIQVVGHGEDGCDWHGWVRNGELVTA